MHNSYRRTKFDESIIGVKREKTIKILLIDDVLILVTRQPTDSNRENYFNVYFVDPMFKQEPLNNLREQIPVENKPKDWEEYLRLQYLQYLAWKKWDMYVAVTKDD